MGEFHAQSCHHLGMVVEEPSRERLRWVRATFASLAALAIFGAGAAIWEFGRRAGHVPDVGGVLFAVAGVHLAGRHWLRHRRRRTDFRWRPRLVVPGGVRPGLLGRWSWRALLIDAVPAVAIVGSGLLMAGGHVGVGGGRSGIVWSAITTSVALAVTVATVRKLCRSGCVVVTAQGVAGGGRFLRWEEIRAVRRHKDGVHVHLRSAEPRRRPLDIDSPQCAVPDERLVQVIEFYLANPQRRSALDTGPDRLALAVDGR